MYRKWLMLLVLIVCAVPLHAQEDADDPTIPLLAYFNEQIYQLNEDQTDLIAYDDCMPEERIIPQFVPSPDGTRFLIPTIPNVFDEAIQAFGSLGDVPVPLNYWLCNTADNTVERIIIQPNADDAFDGEFPPIPNIQGRIRWSPDGMQIAWVQLSFETGLHTVTIIDLTNFDIATFDVDIPPAPFPSPHEFIGWTAQGIILWQFIFDETDGTNIETLYIIDPADEAISAEYELIRGGADADFFLDRFLVQTETGIQLYVNFEQQGQTLINLDTGVVVPVEGDVAQVVSDNPDSLLLSQFTTPEFSTDWIVRTAPDSELTTLSEYPAERVALSADGTQVAYADSTLHILNADNTVLDIGNSDGFADDFTASIWWGSPTTVYLPSSAEAQAAASSCEGAPSIGVQVGDEARVISTTIPNRIRTQPTTSSQIAGEIAPRDSFSVIGGPACAEGYTWFEIQYGELTGWTVEATGESYFIEPVNP
ncbi:MAG: SH3 domain-containing protein [Chloroflexota bacterium]